MNDRDRLISLLKELFRFDKAELDFGIYRIMNQKKDEIENFINNDLVQTIDEEMDQLVSKDKELLEKKIEQIKNEAEDLGVNYKESKKYQRVKDELDSLSKTKNIDTNVYNDIYRFFKRYYDNGDFLSKRRYSKDEKYAIPYNGEEVHLHWANNDQYYVKTTEEFDNYSFKKNWVTVNFKVVQAEEEKNNNKSDEDQYFLLKDKNYFDYDSENKEVNIYFEYRSLTKNENKKYKKRNTQADIRDKTFDKLENKIKSQTKDIYDLGWLINSDKKANPPLKSHLYKYTTKNKSDYFIHKDLKGFFNRELDFFIKNEIMDINAIGTEEEKSVETYLNKVRVIKNVSKKIIEFLAQIEDFQKKLFEKKKFVIDDEYCLTLNKVPEIIQDEIFGKILSNNNQLKEWEKLFDEEVKTKNDLYRNNKLKNLVIDTKYFDEEFKEKILIYVVDISKNIDGYLINSENFQALNMIAQKFKKKIKSIYIDPPFNKENEANYQYKVNYKDSTWISLLENRVNRSTNLIKDAGSMSVRCDYNGNMYVRMLLNELFGKENYRNELNVRRIKKNVQNKIDIKKLPEGLDTIFIYGKDDDFKYIHPFKEKEEIREGYWRHMNDSEGQGSSKVFFGKELEPPQDKHWKYSQENIDKRIEEGTLIIKCGNCGYYHKEGKWNVCPQCGKDQPQPRYWVEPKEEEVLDSNWTDIYGYANKWEFRTENSEKLLKRIIDITSKEKEFIMDFFLGSGTTTAVAHKLNRKWIGIEMGDQFFNTVLPRMKKVISYEESGISSNDDINEIYNKKQSSGMFKYQKLEQYEDTLENIKFESNNLRLINDYDDYLIKYMLDYETKSSVLNIDKFDDPFNYKITITENKEKIDKKVNLIETFNYLIGLKVKTFDVYNQFNRKYKVTSGKKDDESVLVIWRKTIDLDLKADKDFIENNLNIDDYKKVYINGDNYVENSLLIEESFKKLMLND